MAQQVTQIATPPLELTCSQHLLDWLEQQQVSLALTTYQTNRLFLVGVKPDGSLSTFERFFDRAMGLFGDGNRLYLASRYQLWQLDNVLAADSLYDGSYDALYVPRVGWTTGDLNAHDVAIDDTENVVFVNTAYSCLATLDARHSFKLLWKPSFISKLVREDRCHLNGLAMVEGKPRYVTAISRSDVAAGWRLRRQDGGVVIDVASNEIIASGLSMPHSPRFYQGKLWLLNAGTGDFGYLDLDRGKFEPIAFCPGFVRGLAFHQNFALVGLSKPRDRHFGGLALDDRLAAKDAEPRCGVMVIDLKTGDIAHWLELEGVVKELFDVVVLTGVRQPMALGFKTDEIEQVITFAEATPNQNITVAQSQFEQGKRLMQQGNLEAAMNCFIEAVRQKADYAPAYNQLGNVLQALGKTEEAVAAYKQALEIDPNLAALHCNLGNIWQLQGKTEEAVAAYTQALQLKPDFTLALLNLGKLQASQKLYQAAETSYQKVIALQPNNSEAHYLLGIVLQQEGRTDDAIASWRRAIQLNPNYLEAYYSLGTALQSQNALDLAHSCYQRVLQFKPDCAATHFNLGILLDYQDDLEAAKTHYEQALALKPEATEIFYALSLLHLKLCDWQDYCQRVEELVLRTQAHLNSNSTTGLTPLTLNYFPVPLSLHQEVARHRAQLICPSHSAHLPLLAEERELQLSFSQWEKQLGDEGKSNGKIRLGYISPDFRTHAVGILIQDIFQYHNRNVFEVYAYSLVDCKDAATQKIRTGCDKFVDLSRTSTQAAAQRIKADGIDILIDLAGYTTHSRPEILACQPAPIQCTYLGYPDTTGADFIQYLIGDDWVTPHEVAAHYSEKIIRLPHSFVGSALEIADTQMQRQQFGLPEDAFVFCCFNAHQKIEPVVFASWMRILQQVPKSVLWLCESTPTVEENLRQSAQKRGMNPQRLIFSPKLPLNEYLARCRLADLFLDTFIFNAGSTAVTALWAGLPLLTKPGNTYASRMGASICAAAGLDALICASVESYEKQAVHLATHLEELTAHRRQLQQKRQHLPLFNPQQFVGHLEAALHQVWATSQQLCH